jgi:hypothetical protein
LLTGPIGDLRGVSAPHLTELKLGYTCLSDSAAASLAQLSLPRLSFLKMYERDANQYYAALGADGLHALLRAWGGTLATLDFYGTQQEWGIAVVGPLASARLPGLRGLKLGGDLEEADILRLASAAWAPQLTSLHLTFVFADPHGAAGWARLASAPFDALREFEVHYNRMCLQALQSLGAARWLPGLERCQVCVDSNLVASLLGIPAFAALQAKGRLVVEG